MKKTANIDIRFTADAKLRLHQRSSKSNLTDSDSDAQVLCIECHGFMPEIEVRVMQKAPSKYSIV